MQALKGAEEGVWWSSAAPGRSQTFRKTSVRETKVARWAPRDANHAECRTLQRVVAHLGIQIQPAGMQVVHSRTPSCRRSSVALTSAHRFALFVNRLVVHSRTVIPRVPTKNKNKPHETQLPPELARSFEDAPPSDVGRRGRCSAVLAAEAPLTETNQHLLMCRTARSQFGDPLCSDGETCQGPSQDRAAVDRLARTLPPRQLSNEAVIWSSPEAPRCQVLLSRSVNDPRTASSEASGSAPCRAGAFRRTPMIDVLVRPPSLDDRHSVSVPPRRRNPDPRCWTLSLSQSVLFFDSSVLLPRKTRIDADQSVRTCGKVSGEFKQESHPV